MSTGTWLAISAGATFLLAIAAFWAIWQNYRMHQKELKIRLLDKIVEWVTDIQKAGLTVDFPVTNASLSKEQIEDQITSMEANTLLRYGISFIRNNYIKAIVDRAFKKELHQDVENMIEVFTAFLFLEGKSFGMENLKQTFRGKALKTIEKVEKQLKGKSLPNLLDEYSEEKSKCAEILLIKVGNIIASL